ncbi:MAG TPA: helix-turn-helix domain-containing protein [Streptosporangiaceae bacterium]|nr:helix-turn-helix domain-containing protein [Streptosporangiaceae bacterium]
MTCIDAILSAPSLAGLVRVNDVGGDRAVAGVWLAERFSDLEGAPPGSLVILGRVASESATDYRFDMALRWAALGGVGAVAAFAGERWRPPLTAVDIAARAGVALIWVPTTIELTGLLLAVLTEVGGGPALALARAAAGIDAVERAEQAGADPDTMRAMVADSLGCPVERSPEPGIRELVAPQAHGDLAIAARLVLRAAADAAARLADADAKARELPIRSRSELLAELLISESSLNEDMLERARQLGVPLAGWHVAVRIEADNLTGVAPDEISRFELLEAAGQAALGAAAAAGGTWYLSRIARAIVLIWMTKSDPGAQASPRASRSASRALEAITARFSALRLRAGVSTPHEGPLGLRAAAAEARSAIIAARAAGKPPGVGAHDAAGVQRMLMEWYASDMARASVRTQLAPLERLGPARCETAVRTLAAFLDEQGSVNRTAQRLHLHRNAVAYRMRRITALLGVDLDDADQRLALQLACRARLLQ